MPLIHEFEKHNQITVNDLQNVNLPIINKKRYGNGFVDLIPLITKVAKTIGNVYSTINGTNNDTNDSDSANMSSVSNIKQVVKSAKELGKQKKILKNKEKEITALKPKKDLNEIAKIMDSHKGEGFHKF